MVDWDRTNPLALVEGEPTAANQALNDYATMGAGRSLTALIQRYTEPIPTTPPPTKQIATVKRWSVAWVWQERVEAFDELTRQKQRADYESRWAERVEAEREATWDIAQKLRARALEMLQFPLATVEQVTKRQLGPDGKTTEIYMNVVKPAKWVLRGVTQNPLRRFYMNVVKPAKWVLRDAALVADIASKLARLSAELPIDRLAIDGLTTRDLENMPTDQLLALQAQLERRK